MECNPSQVVLVSGQRQGGPLMVKRKLKVRIMFLFDIKK